MLHEVLLRSQRFSFFLPVGRLNNTEAKQREWHYSTAYFIQWKFLSVLRLIFGKVWLHLNNIVIKVLQEFIQYIIGGNTLVPCCMTHCTIAFLFFAAYYSTRVSIPLVMRMTSNEFIVLPFINILWLYLFFFGFFGESFVSLATTGLLAPIPGRPLRWSQLGLGPKKQSANHWSRWMSDISFQCQLLGTALCPKIYIAFYITLFIYIYIKILNCMNKMPLLC